MAEKKCASRFCIQFNEHDVQHQQVMDVLNAQGRHKAQFIAAAILHYINCQEAINILQNEAGLRHTIEAIVFETLEKHKGSSAGRPSLFAADKPQKKIRQPSEISATIDSLGEETLNTIQDSLAAFRSVEK